MKKGTGILLDPATSDLLIRVKRDAQGRILRGLTIGGSTAQNQAIILYSHEGEIKEVPNLGVGVFDMLLDSDITEWRQRISEHLKIDGQQVKKISISKNFNPTIDANYR